MAKTRPNTPSVRDHGHGGAGKVSNTVYPDVNEAGPAGGGGSGDYGPLEAEIQEAMREFDEGQ